MCGGGYAPPTAATLFTGYAPGPGLALRIYWAKGRTKGVAQNVKRTSTAGQSHRLTSGGKAEATNGELLGQSTAVQRLAIAQNVGLSVRKTDE